MQFILFKNRLINIINFITVAYDNFMFKILIRKWLP